MVGEDEIPGRRSIEKAIEERVAMTIKGLVVPENSGSEIKVVADDVDDDDGDSVSVRSSEQGEKTTQVKDMLSSSSTGDVENQLQIGPVDCVGAGADSVGDGNRLRILDKARKSRALREMMALEDKNHARNFSSGISYDPSTKQATEIRNSEKQESEQEANLLDRLSWLQPSFRTLLEPSGSGSGTSSPRSSSGNKTELQEAEKSKWNKKIEKVVAKVKNSGSKKKQPQSSHGNALLETQVKGRLKMKWGEEKKKRQVMKQRTRFPMLCTCFCGGCCCCCSASNNSERTDDDWEFQLGEYSSSW